MKNIITLIAIFFGLILSVNAQYGWINISNSAYTGNYNDVYFINADTGYSVGSTGHVIITQNGGNSGLAVSVTTTSLNSITCLNDSTLLVAGDNGKIYKSTNYGNSWTQKTIGTTNKLNKIIAINDTLVFVGGIGGIFYQSNNGGETWSNNVISGISNEIKSLCFTTSVNGYAVGATSLSGFISRTTSSGAYWTSPYNTISAMNDIDFCNSTNGFAVGDNGAFYKTTSSGASWSYAILPTTQHLHGIQFVNSLVGFIVGDSNTVLKTIDGGNSWTNLTTPTQSDFLCLHAKTTQLVYLGAKNGKALKSTSGGTYLNITVPNYTVHCKGFTNINSTVAYNGTGNLTYHWSPSSYFNNDTLSMPTAGPLSSSSNFYVTVTDGNLIAVDTFTIQVVALNTDSICLVSVDDTTNSNLIVFEKHITGPVDFYKIYRESTVTNVWDSIGFVAADSVGLFTDTSSNPAVMSYRYRISIVDSCGNESVMSNPHTTMHLNINAGVGTTWNLLWNAYQGVFVNKYYIWRGTSKYNLQLLDSVPGTSISYSDINAPASSLYYQVEVVSAYTCLPYNYKANTNYNSSRSNTAHNAYTPPMNVVANFGADPLSGNVPLTVNFTDSSTQTPTYWTWDFGDGQSSSLKNPVHTYTNKGLYSVKLTAWNTNSSDTIEKTDLINVHNVGIENTIQPTDISLIPNPVKSGDAIRIIVQNQTINEISIFNLVGESIVEKTYPANSQISLDVEGIKNGIYYLKIKLSNQQIVTKKLIIQ